MNYKLVIGYDGSRYQGWQKNKNASATIQSKIEGALTRINGKAVNLIGSGRTDKGVHALMQVANCHLEVNLQALDLKAQLNELLPDDIVIYQVEKVDERFHARFMAESKTYWYRIYKADAKSLPLFERKYVFHMDKTLDVDAMRKATEHFLGSHDFKGFSSDKTKKSTVRTINSIDIKEDENTIDIRINGDGFLYNMVRIITGTLIEIGLSERSEATIVEVFESGIREAAGFTVPSKGLVLEEVKYESYK